MSQNVQLSHCNPVTCRFKTYNYFFYYFKAN